MGKQVEVVHARSFPSWHTFMEGKTSNDGLVIDRSGIPRPKWAVDLVDRFLLKVRTKPMWEMIDFIVGIYMEKHPEFFQRSALSFNKLASNKDKSMRHLLSLPVDLKDTIDWFYKPEIKDMGEVKFWRRFAKKYPMLSYAKKI